MTATEWGVVLLGVFAGLLTVSKLPTVTALAGFLGVVLLGTAGFLGSSLTTVGTWTEAHIFGPLLTDIFGTAATFLLTLVLGIVFIHDLLPRNATTRRTAWIGIALGVVIVAGLTGVPALNGLRSDIAASFSSL